MANNKQQKPVSAFQTAVEGTPEIKDAYCVGLKGIESTDRSKVKAVDTQSVDGSLNIDATVKALYPADNRWDYAVSYSGKVYFFEVHPATDGEIETMRRKLSWLKTWLKVKAPLLNALPKFEKPFCWIPSGKTGFLSTAATRKKIALLGLDFQNQVQLK